MNIDGNAFMRINAFQLCHQTFQCFSMVFDVLLCLSSLSTRVNVSNKPFDAFSVSFNVCIGVHACQSASILVNVFDACQVFTATPSGR